MTTRNAGPEKANGHRATTPEELRVQVEHARRELGETVGELAAKADVKAAARHKVTEVKGRARHLAADRGEDPRTYAVAAAVCVLIGLTVVLRIRRHRGERRT